MSKTQGKRTDPYYQAQDILSRRDHTEFEIRTKLKKKGFAREDINKVIDWLHQKKFLDDTRFAHTYITNILATKAVGPRWLSHKLNQKGIAPAIIADALSAKVSPDSERDLARRAAENWQRQHPQYKEDKNRLQRFLLSRGFSFEASATAVEQSAL